MAYQAIENHGIIGDMHTVALVCSNGTIDWLCFPHFDSPSVFAAILDDKKGGYFSISPVGEEATEKQFYWPDTNVLVSRFLCSDGVGEIIDYMPIHNPRREHGNHQVIRRVEIERGRMKFRVECFPAFNYARDTHEVEISEQGVAFHSRHLNLGLATTIDLTQHDMGVVGEFVLDEGESVTFILHELREGQQCGANISENESEQHFERTVDYWRRWLSRCTYRGRWQEMVRRSALALKLLTYQPTGAIVAAPTTSLPEAIGGVRNWDYRYTWIRDAAFTLYGLLRIGFTEEAAHFMHWIEDRMKELEPDGSLQVMYSIHG
ncbi:glycoside hydrolase family 15 protein, partial [candidate division GN15 bacterium]|nr:glycoside hydrolase family 15 protein [candidate division GN15 bacterium]